MRHASGQLADGFHFQGLAALGLKFLHFRDVHMRAHHAHHFPQITVKREGPGEDIDVVPLLVPHPELDLVLGKCSRLEIPQVRQAMLHVLWVEQSLPVVVAALHLVIGIAQHRLPAWRKEQFAGRQVPVPETVVGSLQGEGEALLGAVPAFKLSFLLQGAQNGGDQPGQVLLEHIVADPPFEDFHRPFLPQGTGHHDHRHLGDIPPQEIQDLLKIQLRQVVVGEHQIPVLVDQSLFQCLEAVDAAAKGRQAM